MTESNHTTQTEDATASDLKALLACPFCGNDGTDYILDTRDVAPINTATSIAVYCDNCGAMGGAISVDWDITQQPHFSKRKAEKKAIEIWNMRAS